MPKNPYFNLKPISKPKDNSDAQDMFYGRVELFRRFFSAIANYQSVALVGSRQSGKTSFLLRVCLPEVQQAYEFNGGRFLFIYLDLRKYLHKTCEDFFLAISKAILARCPDLSKFEVAENGGEDEFGQLLELLSELKFFPVLLLDAFDNLTRNKHFDAQFLAFLRALATDGKVSYVTASVAPLSEVCHHGIVDSPFFNIFYNYQLGPLTREEARDLITAPAQETGLPFTETEITFISRLAGRHPFFIQRVCHCFFEEKLLHSNSNEEGIRKLAYADLLPHFNHTWERLPEVQQAILREEARKPESSDRKLPELSESDLFRQFVRLTCGLDMFELTPKDIEDALEKLDDAKALGETKLRFLNIVAWRQKNSSSSAVERGLIIRAILNEAFERLRGPLVRTDTDSSIAEL